MNILGVALLTYFMAFIALAMGWRSYRVWRQTGINPYKLGNADTAHDLVGRLFRFVFAAIGGILVLFTFVPEVYAALEIQGWHRHPWLTGAGVFLLAAAFLWILAAQAQMGISWRIGIDADAPTPLVRQGLFRLSRNPIFLGMRVCLLGFLLVLPNAATVALFLLGDVLMQIQVRLEEEHLRKLHGQDYEDYRATTRRWL